MSSLVSRINDFGRLKTVLLALGFALIAIASIRAASLLPSLHHPSKKATAEVVQVQNGKGLNAIRFKITPRGIEPDSLTLPPGRYLVAIDNDNDMDATALNFSKNTGEVIKFAPILVSRRKTKDYMVFTPGQYVLQDPNNPIRAAKVTVSAN